MDALVNKIIDGCASAFKEAKPRILDAGALAAYQSLIDELVALGKKSRDLKDFNEEADRSDILNRLDEHARKAVGTAVLPDSHAPARALPTKDELVRHYRAGCDAIRDLPHMARTRAVYEEYFALAEKASGAAGLQRDAEHARFTARITAQPVYDTYSLLCEKHDPNETTLRAREESVMRAARESRSPDELAYRVELEVRRARKEITRDTFIQYLIISFAHRLLSYNIGKANARLMPAECLGPFVLVREEAAKSYAFMKDAFGLDWDTITGTGRYVKWLLGFQPLSADTSRVNISLDPGNLGWMKEALFEEILTDRPAGWILLRASHHVFNPAMDSADSDGVHALTAAAGWERIKHFAWVNREKMSYLK